MNMALFEDLTLGSLTSNALLGLGLVVAAPLLAPVVAELLRPVAKLAITGGIVAYDAAAAMVSTAGQELNHIVTDVRAATPATGASEAEEVAPHIVRPAGTFE
jgi:hypothetical protein